MADLVLRLSYPETASERSSSAPLERCQDCKTPVRDTVRPGRHAAHWRDGKLVNCQGKEIG